MNNIQTKDELLEQISIAVEKIQKCFTLGDDVIKDCEETAFLCKCINDILHHGLKEGLISWAMEPNVWPLLEKVTCTEDIEQIKNLHLKNDKEKCSAWIKMAVNLNLLGSYISAVHQDQSLLSHYYDYAFLRDAVSTGTVQSLLNYGIANFDFQITVGLDRMAALTNDTHKPVTHVDYDSYEQETKENGNDMDKRTPGAVDSFNKKKRKKKKQPVNTVVISDLNNDSFEELTNGDSEQSSELVTNHSHDNIVGESDKPSINSDTNHVNTTLKTAMKSEPVTGDLGDVHLKDSEKIPANFVNTMEQKGTTDTARCRGEGITREHENTLGISGDPGRERSTEEGRKVKSDATKFPNEGIIGKHVGVLGISSDSNEQTAVTKEQQETTNDTLLPNERIAGEPVITLGTSSDSNRQRETIPTSNAEEDAVFLETPTNAFSSNDFLLENDSSVSTSGISEAASTPSENESAVSEGSSRDLRNASKTDEPEKTGKPASTASGECAESDKPPPLANDTGKRSLPQSPLNYRVKKVENPEFVSSSYSSSYSDVTDMSFDDRDFIPGIHSRRTSSFQSTSSCDPKSSISFDEDGFPVFDSSHFTDSSSRPSSIDGSSGRFLETSNDWDMFDDLLNMDEEHFAGPDNFAGLTTSEELEIAIEHYKKMIKSTQRKFVDRDKLVQRLIKLRLRLQQERDGIPAVNPEIRKVVSHHFQKQEENPGRKSFCDQCGKIIWGLWQPLFTCKDCGYLSHKKCLEHIKRPCPIKNLSSLSFILNICPDSGLDAQQYRCAECRRAIAVSKDGVSEARLCDYTGQYYCDHCHWNDHLCIPARVVYNWDFTQYKVCRQTKQLLDLMKTRPLLNLQLINPMLFTYVEELREVRKLREDILVMKKYFLTCREALESKLLIQLQKRQHFVDSTDSYSFQDLLDLNNDVLVPEISKIHALFLAHIKADCELCRARGFICEVCQDSKDIIFAFDPHTVKCANCSAVFHKICFKPEDCPKCRRKKRVVEKT